MAKAYLKGHSSQIGDYMEDFEFDMNEDEMRLLKEIRNCRRDD
ncbi:MAG: hypothetical protein ABII39_04495 [Candidatus Micrarchaeota archaeon]